MVLNCGRVLRIKRENVSDDDDGGQEGLYLHDDHVLQGQVQVANQFGEWSSLITDDGKQLKFKIDEFA